MCAFSGLLLSLCSPPRQQNLFVDLSLSSPLCTSSSSSLPPVCFSCLSSPSYLLPVPRAPALSVLPPCSIHISEEISLPRGNLKSGSCVCESKKKKKELHSIFFSGSREKEWGAPFFSPFCNHFLCWSIKRGISQSRGQVKLLHSLRTHVNKTASR